MVRSEPQDGGVKSKAHISRLASRDHACDGLLLLDLSFGLLEALLLFALWIAQFLFPDTRDIITALYLLWAGTELVKILYRIFVQRTWPRALRILYLVLTQKKERA